MVVYTLFYTCVCVCVQTAAHCCSTFALYPYLVSEPVKSLERMMPHVLQYAAGMGLMIPLEQNPLVVVVSGRNMIMAKGHEINNLMLETVVCGDRDDVTIKRKQVRPLRWLATPERTPGAPLRLCAIRNQLEMCINLRAPK